MPFTQTFQGPVHNVYNVDGTLILSAESKAPDLARELVAIRTQLTGLGEVDGSTRDKVETELKAAEVEAKAPHPSGSTIKGHLDQAASTLESASGVAERAGKLAETLVRIGSWALAILA